MRQRGRVGRTLSVAILAVFALVGMLEVAAEAQNSAPNPYRTVENWATLPDGRTWGATSAIYPAADGNIWIAERCGANICVESDVDPVLLFDPSGKVVKSFGSGLIAWPHGIFVDKDGNVWIADAVGYAPVPEGWGSCGLQVQPRRRAFDDPRTEGGRRGNGDDFQQTVGHPGGAERGHLHRRESGGAVVGEKRFKGHGRTGATGRSPRTVQDRSAAERVGVSSKWQRVRRAPQFGMGLGGMMTPPLGEVRMERADAV